MNAHFRQALVLALFLPLALGAAELKRATVTQAFNEVKVIAPNRPDEPAASGATIAGERGLRTGDKSRAELEFQDKTLTRLGANTIFSFEGGTREMEMQQGTMLLQVPKNAGGAKIRTAAVTAAITGTTILLEYTPDMEVIENGVKKKKKGKIKVIVLEGTLRLSLNNGSGQTVTLGAGQMLVTDPSAVQLPGAVEVDLRQLAATSLLVNNSFWGQEAALAAGQSPAQAAAAVAAGAGRLLMPLIDEQIARQQELIAAGILGSGGIALTPLGNEVMLIGSNPLAQVDVRNSVPTGPVLPPLPPNDGVKFGALPAVVPGPYTLGAESIVQLDPVVTGPSGRVEGRIYRGNALDGSPAQYAFGTTATLFDTAFGAATDSFFVPIAFPSPGVTFFKFDSLILTGTPLFVIAGGPNALALVGQNGITTASSGSIDFSSLRDVTLVTQAAGITLSSGFQILGGAGDRLSLGARGAASDLTSAAQIVGFAQVRGGAERDLLLGSGGRIAASARVDLFAGRNLSFEGQLAAPAVTLTAQAGLLTFNPTGLDTAVVLDLTSTARAITLTGSLNAGATASQLRFNAGAGGFNAGTFTLGGTARQISVTVTGGNFTAGAFTGNALTLTGGGTINVGGALNVSTLTFDGPISAGSITATTINATNATFAGPINAGTVNVGGTSLTLTGGGSGAFVVPAGSTLTVAGGTQALNATSISGAGAVRFQSGVNSISGAYTISGSTTLSGGSVDFNGGSLAANFALSSGTLGGSGLLRTSGVFDWTGGTMGGSGTTSADAVLNLSGPAIKTLSGSRTLVANGTTSFSGGNLVLNGTSRFVNQAVFNAVDGAAIGGAGTFLNALGASFTKSGAGTTTTVSVPFLNSGAVNVASGSLILGAGGASTGGSFSVGSAGSLEFTNLQSTFDAASTISGNGTVIFSDVHDINGTYNVAGTTIVNGVANFNGPTSLGTLVAGGLSVFANSVSPGLTSIFGEVRIATGQTFTINNPLVLTGFPQYPTLGGSGTFIATRGVTFDFTNPQSFIDGIVLDSGATLVIPAGQVGIVQGGQAASMGMSATLQIYGTLENDGTFFARAERQGQFSIAGSAGTIGARQFINRGTFIRETGTDVFALQALFLNSGTVSVRSGTLEFLGLGSFTQTAGSTTLEGGSLKLLGGRFDFLGGLLTGSGLITGNVNNSAAITPSIGTTSTGLAITGNLSLLTGSTLNFTLGGLTAGSGYGFLSAGSAALGGRLVLSFANGFENSIATANTFTLVSSASPFTGSFTNVASGSRVATSDNLGTFLVSYSGSTLTLSNFLFSAVTDATYLGGTNGWGNALGWTSNPNVPNNGNASRTYNVIVNSGSLTQDISGGVTVERMTMTGGTITLSNPLTLNAGLNYSGGTIQSGTLTLAGSSVLAQPLGTNGVSLILTGDLAPTYANGNLFGGATTLFNNGRVLLPGGGDFALNAGGSSTGVFDVPATSQLDLVSSYSFLNGTSFTGGGAVVVSNGVAVTFAGAIRNEGTFLLNSTGSFTDLLLSGTVTLNGGGTLVLGDAGRIRSGGGAATLINVDNVIQGNSNNSGNLGNNDVALVNQVGGIIQSNLAGRFLLVDPAASGGLVNTGLLRALNGGTLRLQGNGGGAFDNTGGTISALDASTVELVGGAALTGGILSTSGTGTITNVNIASLTNLTLNGNFVASNGSATTLFGGIVNTGSMQLAAAGSFTDFLLSGNVTLSGGGRVLLQDAARVRSAGGAATLINVDNVFSGETSNSSSLGNNDVAIVNQPGGVIDANSPGKILLVDVAAAGGLLNTGILRASGGGILQLSGNGGGGFDNTGGVVEALAGSEVQLLNNASLVGGVLNGPGLIRNVNAATLTNVTLNTGFLASNGSITTLAGSLTNNSDFVLNSVGSFTDLLLSGDVTLFGSGTLTLGNSGRIRSAGGSAVLTNAGNFIRGESTNGGSFGNNDIGILNQSAGIISANVSGAFLNLDPDLAHGLINEGLLLAENGGLLRLTGNGGGVFSNTAGIIRAGNASEVQFVNSASVVGGILTSTGSGLFRNLNVAALSNLTLAAPFVGDNGSTTTLVGTLVNNGSLTLASMGSFTDLLLSGDVTLTGGGTLALQNAARIRSAGGLAGLINVDNLIRGENHNAGSIGNNELALTNQAGGIFDADVAGLSLQLDPSTAGMINRGLLRASNGGILLLTGNGGGSFDNVGGTIRAGAGSEVQFVTNATLSGGSLVADPTGLLRVVNTATLSNFTLDGLLRVDNGAALTLSGTFGGPNARLLVASSGSSTDLLISGSVNFSSGTLRLQSADRIRTVGGAAIFTNSGTIAGENNNSGSIGNNDTALVNTASGVITADQSGLHLNLDPSLSGFVNAGILRSAAGGILFLNGNGGGSFDSSGTIENTTGGRIVLTGALTSSGTVDVADSAMDISSGGTFTQTGGNFLIAGGSVTSSTNLVFSGGLLNGYGVLNGTVDNSAILRPAIGVGSTGLTISGPLLLRSTSRLEFTLGGLVQGSGYGFISTGSGTLLGGQILVSFANGFQNAIQQSNTFTLLTTTTANFSGSFSTPLPGGRLFTADGLGSFLFTNNGSQITLSDFQVAVVLGATYSGGTGNWSDPTLWSTNPLVPNNGSGGNSFDVVFPNGTVTQDIASGVTIQKLTLTGGNIIIPAGNSLTSNGLFTWSSNALLTGPGTYQANGGVTFTGNAFSDIVGGLTFNVPAGQTVLHINTNQIRLGGGAVFNSAGNFFARTNFGITQLAGGGTFNNSGNFTRDVSTGLYPIGAGVIFNNTGTVNVNNGVLALGGGGTSTGGIFNINFASTLRLNGTYNFDAASNIANIGTLEFAAGNTTYPGAYSGGGTVLVSGGATTFSASTTLGTLTLTGGSLAIAPSRNLNITGPINWNLNSVLNGGGTVNALGGGVFGNNAFSDLTGGTTLNLAVGQTVTHNGSNEVRLGGGSVINNAGLFLEQTVFGVTQLTGGGSFLNSGTFLRDTNTGTANIGLGIAFLNSGTVTVNTGTLAILGGGAGTGGTFAAAAGATLRFGSNYAFDATSTLDGGGTIAFSAGAQSLAGTYTGTGLLLVSGGALSVSTSQSLASLQLLSGSLNLPAGRTINVNSAMIWNGSSILTGGGTFHFNGGTLFGGNAFSDIAGGTIVNLAPGQTAVQNGTNQIRLAGGATLNNGGTFQADTDFGITGTGTVNNSGTFTRGNSAGSYGIAVPFTNSGTVNANSGTIAFTGGFTQSAGTVALNGGNVAGSTLVFNGGLLTGFGSVTAAIQNAAEIRPSIGGTGLLVTGNVSLLAASQLTFSIGGLTQGSQYGFLGVTGSVALGGTLALFVTNGFESTLTGANTFTLLTTTGALSGAFSNATSGTRLATSDGLGSFLVTTSGTSVVLSNFLPPGPVTTNWTGTTGNWSVGANWSTGTVPNGATTDVAIDNARAGVASNVSVDGNFAVRDLTIDVGDSLTILGSRVLTVNGVVRNNGSLTIQSSSATLAFVNATTLTGTGTLTFGGSNAILSSPGFTNGPGHTVTGNGMVNGPFTNQGIVRPTGSNLTFNNGFAQDAATGSLIMAGGTVTSASPFLIGAGSVTGFGTLAGGLDNAGTINPSGNTLAVTGALTLRSTSALGLSLGGVNQGNTYSFLSVTGPAALAGSLTAGFTGGFGSSVTNANVFTFLTATSLPTGTFANVGFGTRLTTTDNLGSFLLTRSGNSLQLTDFLATITSFQAGTWLTAASGAWTTGSNWSGGVVPNDGAVNGTGYNVTIGATGGPYTVSLASAIIAQSLNLNSANATLTLNSGANLRIVNTATVQAGTLAFNSGTLRGGTLNVSGGALSFSANSNNVLDGVNLTGGFSVTTNNGTVRLDNGTQIAGTVALSGLNSTLGFNQTATVGGFTLVLGTATTAAFVGVEGTNTLTLASTAVVRGVGQFGAARIFGGTSTLINQGAISADVSGQTLSLTPNFFTNQGTVSALNGGTLTLGTGTGQVFTNTGTITATNSTVNLGANFTAGTVGTLNASNSAINLSGLFATAGLAGINRTGGTVTLSGTLTNTGATLTLTPSLGVLGLASGTIVGGTLDNSAGDVLSPNSSGANVLSGVTVLGGLNVPTANGTFRLDNGTQLSGTVALSGLNSLLGFNQTGTVGGFTVVLGTATTGAFLGVEGNNTLTLASTVVIRGVGQVGGARIFGGTGTLINQGTISADVTGQTLGLNPNIFNNQGTVSALNGGTLTLGTGTGLVFTNTGTITATNSTVNLGANFTAGTVGTLNASNSAINLTGLFTTGGLAGINRTGGTVTLSGTLTNTAATLTLTPTLGVIALAGGTIAGGTLDNSAGDVLLPNSSGANVLSGVTVLGGLNLSAVNGTFRLDSGTQLSGTVALSGLNSTLGFNQTGTFGGFTVVLGTATTGAFLGVESNNTLTLASSVLIRGVGQVGGARIFGGTGTLINQGTISADVSGQTLAINPNIFTNQGTVSALNGGILTLGTGTSQVFTNAGTITVTNSTLNLGGDFRAGIGTLNATNSTINLSGLFNTSGLANINRTGGTVNIAGQLDNTGQVFTLPAGLGPVILAGGRIFGGTLNIPGGTSLTFNSSSNNRLDGVAVNGTLDLNTSGATVLLQNGTNINGTVNLTATGSTLGLLQSTTLSGPVTINLDAPGVAFLSVEGANTPTLGSGVIVRGSGTLNTQQVFGGTFSLTNQGSITADLAGRTLTIGGTTFTNSGTLAATNGATLSITSTNWQSSGTINLSGGGIVNLGGTVPSSGLGTINNSGGTLNLVGTLNNTGNTYTLPASASAFNLVGGMIRGGTLNVSPGVGAAPLGFNSSTGNRLDAVTVNGTLDLNSTSATLLLQNGANVVGTVNLTGTNSIFGLALNTTLSGPLTINLDAPTNAFLSTEGASNPILGSGVVVRGAGTLNTQQAFGGAFSLTNQGSITADISGRTLTIAGTTFTNSGTLAATNGATLSITSTNWQSPGTINLSGGAILNLGGTLPTSGLGPINNSGGSINLVGTLNNTGNTYTLPASAGSFTLAGGIIRGGTLNVSPGGGAAPLLFTATVANRLDAVTVNGTLNLGPTAAIVLLQNGANVVGTVNLTGTNSIFGLAQNTTLSGPLTINLDAPTNSFISVEGANNPILGSGVIVRGAGTLNTQQAFGGAFSLTNQGSITADLAGRTLTIGGTTFTNSGTLAATNGATLSITSTNWQSPGTINVSGSSILNLGGTLPTSSLGTINNSGGTLNLVGTLNNTGNTYTLPSSADSFTLAGGTIRGGTLNVSPGAGAAPLLFTNSVSNRLDAVTVVGTLNLGPVAAAVLLQNGANVVGTVNLTGTNSIFGLAQNTTLSGPLTINLDAPTNAFLSVEGANNPILGSGVIVRGAGTLNTQQAFGGAFSLTNQGSITADISGRTLTIAGTTFTNSGTLAATNGATLSITSTNWQSPGTINVSGSSILNLGGTLLTSSLGPINNSGGSINLVGTLNNTGNTYTLPSSAGSFTLASGTIRGGTLNVSPGAGAAPLLFTNSVSNRLDAVTVVGTLNLGPVAAAVLLQNGANVVGTVNLTGTNSIFGLAQNTTLSGPLTINLDAPTNAFLSVEGANNPILGSGVIVRGAGTLNTQQAFGGTFSLTNQGSITADLAGRTLTIAGTTFTNSGTLAVVNGATLTLSSSTTTSTGALNVVNGSLSISGAANMASLTGTTGSIGLVGALPLTAANGINFSGASGALPGDGGSLTLTGNTVGTALSLGTGVGTINGLLANGGDSSSGAGGNGGTISATASNGDLLVNADVEASSGANTVVATGGNGGTVNLTANTGTVNITRRVQVSHDTAGRRSARGGDINVTSGRSGVTAITISSTAQLQSLLNAAAPGPGGKITIVATGTTSNIAVGGNVRADRGTVEVRNNGTGGTINVASTAALRGDVVKIGALGNNGILTIAGGDFNADTTIRLYATGSNGQVQFTGNTTLQGTSVKQIAAQTVTINNGVQVNVLGSTPANVFTNVPNYTGSGGNGSTTGAFTGQGATTAPLGGQPGF